MNASPDVIRLVRQWIEKAEEDWRTADYTLTMPEGTPYATICFHAQQCVEKWLKALLVLNAIAFPRIHDIGELLQLLPPDLCPELSIQEQERLTDYATTDRYPGDYEPIDREEAERAVALAGGVRSAMRQLLPSEALGP
jgi:HEPN domain-containing protein